MKTQILYPYQIDEVISILKNGDLVALPTETVYGLAADAKNEQAVKKVFLAKNRPSDHPLIVHVDCLDRVYDWVELLPEEAIKLAQCFWPGPLTMLLWKKKQVSNLISGGSQKIAIRIPKTEFMRNVIKKLDSALVAPSANKFKCLSPTRAEHVLKDLEGKISAVVDGGACEVGIESTIIDLTSDCPQILRPGIINIEMVEEVLEKKLAPYQPHLEKVSGNLKVHYQPKTSLSIMSLSEIYDYVKTQNNQEKIAILHYTEISDTNLNLFSMENDRVNYAKSLYEMLHKIDLLGYDKILLESPPSSWVEINDRIVKAAAS